MITILPMEDQQQKKAVLSRYPMLSGKGDVMVMAEKSDILGTVVLSVDGTVLRMYDMTVSGQSLKTLDSMGKMIADSLMRAAASYGETNGAEQVISHVAELAWFFAQKGFLEEAVHGVEAVAKLQKRKGWSVP